jgi:hypothetical protein
MDFAGLALNAPARIATNRRDKLPLIMAARYSGERDWEVGQKENCFLVATNLLNGRVTVVNALMSEKELLSRGGRVKPPKGPKPSGLASDAAQITEIDARAQLDLLWNTAEWAFGVVWYDWMSNSVEVALQGNQPIPPSPPLSVDPSPSASGTASLPSYEAIAGKTPTAPDSGAAFSLEFRAEQAGQRLYVYGAFNVRLRPLYLTQQRNVTHRLRDGRQAKVAAIVPVTMILLLLDRDTPWQFDWLVPVYADRLNVGTIAHGCFAMDALASGTTRILSPGTYVAFVVVDGRIYGPKTFQVSLRG